MAADKTEVLTLRQTATWLQVSERTVLRMIDTGELPGFKVGRQWRFREQDIEAYMASLALTGRDIDKRRGKEIQREELEQVKQAAKEREREEVNRLKQAEKERQREEIKRAKQAEQQRRREEAKQRAVK